MIEDNLLEIEKDVGLPEKEMVIVVDNYYVIKGMRDVDWKFHWENKVPLRLDGLYAHAKDGLIENGVKVGDFLFFKDQSYPQTSQIKKYITPLLFSRIISGPFYQVKRLLENGLSAELQLID